MASERPAPHPAAVVTVVHADHLIQVFVAGKGDAITLMQGHGSGVKQSGGGAERKGFRQAAFLAMG